jgi:hydrogenase expression/formation protein HypE
MADTQHIQLAHGGGGQLTGELIHQVILPSLGKCGSQDPAGLSDAAIVKFDRSPVDACNAGNADNIAFTTDSYVVTPLEFPGADIGKLCVCGTVNDLSVAGAGPAALSLALVLEEGLEISLLRRVLVSAGLAAELAGVKIVTGDTKVVERGGVSGMIINTAGIGRMMGRAQLGFDRVGQGDCVIVSGPLGEHGLAVMSKRKGLGFSAGLKSDCAPLNKLTIALIEAFGHGVKFMRDPTRGGLAATVVDLSAATGRDVELDESAIPVNRTARAAAEMLGLDLLTIANEGKLVAVVAADVADKAVELLRQFDIAKSAAVIGTVGLQSEHPIVEMVTQAGGRRVVQMPYGEELPRIC